MISDKQRKEMIDAKFRDSVAKNEAKKESIINRSSGAYKSQIEAKLEAAKQYWERVKQQNKTRQEILNREPVRKDESTAQRRKRAQLQHRTATKEFDNQNLWKEPPPEQLSFRQMTQRAVIKKAEQVVRTCRKYKLLLLPFVIGSTLLLAIAGFNHAQSLGEKLQTHPIDFRQWEKDHPKFAKIIRWMYGEKSKNQDYWNKAGELIKKYQ
ncbi:hypothetical protein Mmc1_0796 [Magnetococcus marinus MC-1]|uniref:Transmembrane protein n=1 Tax=Magnetococcus marinus (strain ATCC BAA-1437 / JCM 17883 / MC-1) TaxID=156889 RepID=A0L5S4_MAGMM|nr:hypothetical protein [Magnetococcus marinus]ABK43317.1 hypothetical protein Mmc1_0796 [Magnetococcus marinus MC-1]